MIRFMVPGMSHEEHDEVIARLLGEVSARAHTPSSATYEGKRKTCCQGECDDCGGLDDNGEGV